MKQILHKIILIFVLTTLFAGCEKEENLLVGTLEISVQNRPNDLRLYIYELEGTKSFYSEYVATDNMKVKLNAGNYRLSIGYFYWSAERNFQIRPNETVRFDFVVTQ